MMSVRFAVFSSVIIISPCVLWQIDHSFSATRKAQMWQIWIQNSLLIWDTGVSGKEASGTEISTAASGPQACPSRYDEGGP